MTCWSNQFRGTLEELEHLLERIQRDELQLPWELARFTASNEAVKCLIGGDNRAIPLARIALTCADRYAESDEFTSVVVHDPPALAHICNRYKILLSSEINIRAFLYHNLGEVDEDLSLNVLLELIEDGVSQFDNEAARVALDRPLLCRRVEEIARQRSIRNFLIPAAIVLEVQPTLPTLTDWWWARYEGLP